MSLKVCHIVNYAVYPPKIIFVLYFVHECSCLIINIHLLIIAVASSNSVCEFLFIFSAHFKLEFFLFFLNNSWFK